MRHEDKTALRRARVRNQYRYIGQRPTPSAGKSDILSIYEEQDNGTVFSQFVLV
jgi:hypothetical protein